MPNPIVSKSKHAHKPTGTVAKVFGRCHAYTSKQAPPGDYFAAFDTAGDSLEAVISCPICRNPWVAHFSTIEMMSHYASHFGRIVSYEETSELSWVLACPRCVMNAKNPRAQYADYLRSPHWQKTRAEAIDRAGGRCQVCNAATALQVHHRTYQRRGYEDPADLIVLCDDCHKTFHAHGRLAS